MPIRGHKTEYFIANMNFLNELGSLVARRLKAPRALHLSSKPKKCAGFLPYTFTSLREGNNGFLQGESKSQSVL